MAKKLTPAEWEQARAFYESGNSGNATAAKFGLSRRNIQLRVQAEGWDQNLENAIRVQALDQVMGKGPNYTVEATAAAVEVEATKRATVEKRHREEPNNVRVLLNRAIKAMDAREKPADIREIKSVAETMALLHRMEREAYRLDDGKMPTGGGAVASITLNVVRPQYVQ